VAALLFKVDYAWQHGLTQGSDKPCTSLENRWISPTLVKLEPVKAAEMVVENPRVRYGTHHRPVVRQSTASRNLFATARSQRESVPMI